MNLSKEFERACEKTVDSEFDDLAERDRVLVAIWALEGDVNNGGFDQYFFNSSGDTAYFAPEALRLIGAHRMAAIVRTANSFFGAKGPPREIRARRKKLFRLTASENDLFDKCDTAFYDYPDDIGALLITYLSRMNDAEG